MRLRWLVAARSEEPEPRLKHTFTPKIYLSWVALMVKFLLELYFILIPLSLTLILNLLFLRFLPN